MKLLAPQVRVFLDGGGIILLHSEIGRNPGMAISYEITLIVRRFDTELCFRANDGGRSSSALAPYRPMSSIGLIVLIVLYRPIMHGISIDIARCASCVIFV